MKTQFCKVGAITPITSGENAIYVLENQYEVFIKKAFENRGVNSQLQEFFELKARKIKKTLEDLVG